MLKIVLSVIQVLLCLFLIFVVLLQSGKSAGLSGAIAGGMDSFVSNKAKARSIDAKLAKYTKYVALVFVIMTLILNFLPT
ncbi:MAG: preprotein translocase subunit SecG [Oscillospiraceae bacterium]|nr:preprotein translocase subunit SecG [Oscillospiraceae bacterium]